MLNTIYDWEPQASYDGYNPDRMYAMDYVAKVVLESDYKLVNKTLKEFAITVVSLSSYWHDNNLNNERYILDSEEQVRQLIGTNFSSFDNGHWAKLYDDEKDNILQLYI